MHIRFVIKFKTMYDCNVESSVVEYIIISLRNHHFFFW